MRWFMIAAGFVLVVWAVLWILLILLIDDPAQRGQFGDMFGASTALFSGLAFAGVIIAMLYQREELSLQRQELALQRQELARSAEAQEQLVKTQERSALMNARATLMAHFSEGVSFGNVDQSAYQRQAELLIASVNELEPTDGD